MGAGVGMGGLEGVWGSRVFVFVFIVGWLCVVAMEI